MSKWLTQAKISFEALSLRQQLVFITLSFLGIYFVWYWLLFVPAHERKTELHNKTADIQNQLSDLRNKINTDHSPPNWPKDFNAQKLSLQTDKVIPMMKEIMRKQPGLELMSITTKPPEPLKLDEVLPSRINPNREEVAATESRKQHAPNTDNAESTGTFRQVITLQFQGDYFSTLKFLEKLEALPWVLINDGISYAVINYPQANITIQLNLLSLAQGLT